jgi:hypothetical protein
MFTAIIQTQGYRPRHFQMWKATLSRDRRFQAGHLLSTAKNEAEQT